jgi:hypothetical protein
MSNLQGSHTINDTPVNGKTSTLVLPFTSANKVPAKSQAKTAKAKATTATTASEPKAKAKKAPALAPTPKHNNESIKAYEHQFKMQAKIERQADNAVDMEAFIQATVNAFVMHTNSKLITDAIAKLTQTLHMLLLKVHDYQAKATKFSGTCPTGFLGAARVALPSSVHRRKSPMMIPGS